MKLAFTASMRPDAQSALNLLRKKYGHHEDVEADVIVALGGDGHMLSTLRQRFGDKKPVYGMNRGTVGFLMNAFDADNLYERIDNAERVLLNPLRMRAICKNGDETELLAINEVSLLRQTAQTARLKINVDNRERLSELVCDGILLATPAGSTAYNLSAHGPILPVGASLVALTPISPFRPRRWRGALLRQDAVVCIEVMDAERRPVAAAADNQEVRDIIRISMTSERNKNLIILFDPDHALDERILHEQFGY